MTVEEIKFAQNQLNERPRKVLNWDCPKNAFKILVGAIESRIQHLKRLTNNYLSFKLKNYFVLI